MSFEFDADGKWQVLESGMKCLVEPSPEFLASRDDVQAQPEPDPVMVALEAIANADTVEDITAGVQTALDLIGE